MKIGICTCYDNHNYGSMLQAYATYVKFVELGYDCEFLCYRKKLNTIQKIKWLPRLLNKYLMKEKFRLIEKKKRASLPQLLLNTFLLPVRLLDFRCLTH